jgi:hypothetical protein
MTRAWTKILLVVFGLLGMTSSFGQDITLKKLYDSIEDMRLEAERNRVLSREETLLNPFEKETVFLKKTIQKRFKACMPIEEGIKLDMSVRKFMTGSFTKPYSNQKLYLTDWGCELWGEGISIIEGTQSVAFYES